MELSPKNKKKPKLKNQSPSIKRILPYFSAQLKQKISQKYIFLNISIIYSGSNHV